MNAQGSGVDTHHKREFSPEISLSTQLCISGGELLELAGAIMERGSADHYKLDRADKAVRKVVVAIDEYFRRTDPAWLAREAAGSRRAEDMLPEGYEAARTLPYQRDDTPPEAA